MKGSRLFLSSPETAHDEVSGSSFQLRRHGMDQRMGADRIPEGGRVYENPLERQTNYVRSQIARALQEHDLPLYVSVDVSAIQCQDIDAYMSKNIIAIPVRCEVTGIWDVFDVQNILRRLPYEMSLVVHQATSASNMYILVFGERRTVWSTFVTTTKTTIIGVVVLLVLYGLWAAYVKITSAK